MALDGPERDNPVARTAHTLPGARLVEVVEADDQPLVGSFTSSTASAFGGDSTTTAINDKERSALRSIRRCDTAASRRPGSTRLAVLSSRAMLDCRFAEHRSEIAVSSARCLGPAGAAPRTGSLGGLVRAQRHASLACRVLRHTSQRSTVYPYI